jgi:hypothetical protein
MQATIITGFLLAMLSVQFKTHIPIEKYGKSLNIFYIHEPFSFALKHKAVKWLERVISEEALQIAWRSNAEPHMNLTQF